jgi:hypothetical protein
MFKNPFQVAVTFAVIAMAIKLTVFSMGLQHGVMENYIWYVYMFLLLVSILLGIKTNKIMYEGVSTFSQNFRSGARTASFFALLMFVITYFYYTKIDPNFFPLKQQPYLDGLLETAQTKLNEGVSKKEVINGLNQSILKVKQQLSPYAHSMLTLFGLVFIGMFNSLIFSFLMKKFPKFR